jgi:hypothetical protein
MDTESALTDWTRQLVNCEVVYKRVLKYLSLSIIF